MPVLQTASNLNNEMFVSVVFQELGVSYVSVYILFIYFSCFIVLVTTSRTNVKKSGEKEDILELLLIVRGNHAIIHH